MNQNFSTRIFDFFEVVSAKFDGFSSNFAGIWMFLVWEGPRSASPSENHCSRRLVDFRDADDLQTTPEAPGSENPPFF